MKIYLSVRDRFSKEAGHTSTMANAWMVLAIIVLLFVLVIIFGGTGDTGNVGG